MKTKRTKKIGAFLLTLGATVGILAACSSENSAGDSVSANGQDLVLEYQSAPGTVLLPELAEALGYLGDLKLKNVGDYVGGPESIQLTATRETDFGTAFNGALVKSYAQGVKIKSVIGSYGSNDETFYGYYVLEDSDIKTAKDLIGKKIGVNILGAHAEVILQQFLRNSGLTENEIKKVELITVPTGNAEQVLRAGQIDVVVLSSIFKEQALKNGGIRALFKDIDLYGEFTGGSYFFSEKYIKENPETVKTFVEGVAKAIEWEKTTPREEVIAKLEEIVSSREGNQSTESIKQWKGTGIAEEGGQIKEKDFKIWFDWLVTNGKIKDGQVKLEDVYTNEYNPYVK